VRGGAGQRVRRDLGTQWTEALAEAWHSAYDTVAEAMMFGSSPVRDRHRPRIVPRHDE
jgi:hypothetical protein